MSRELLKAVCVPAEAKDNDPDGGYDDDDADDLHCPGTEDTAGAASPRCRLLTADEEQWCISLTLNFPVSVVKISVFKIHSHNVWHMKMAGFCTENSKLKVFLIAKDEKQISLRMSLTKAL